MELVKILKYNRQHDPVKIII